MILRVDEQERMIFKVQKWGQKILQNGHFQDLISNYWDVTQKWLRNDWVMTEKWLRND